MNIAPSQESLKIRDIKEIFLNHLSPAVYPSAIGNIKPKSKFDPIFYCCSSTSVLETYEIDRNTSFGFFDHQKTGFYSFNNGKKLNLHLEIPNHKDGGNIRVHLPEVNKCIRPMVSIGKTNQLTTWHSLESMSVPQLTIVYESLKSFFRTSYINVFKEQMGECLLRFLSPEIIADANGVISYTEAISRFDDTIDSSLKLMPYFPLVFPMDSDLKDCPVALS